MSRATDEWIGKTDDEAAPPRVRLRIWDRAQGQCQDCTRKLRAGHWAVDHIVALVNGGENRENNLQALCSSPCHWRKTRADVAEKSKTARNRKLDAGIKKPRTIRAWRKFDGTAVFAPRQR